MAKKVKETEKEQEVLKEEQVNEATETQEQEQQGIDINDLNPINSMQIVRNALELGNKNGAFTLSDATWITKAWEVAAEFIQQNYTPEEA